MSEELLVQTETPVKKKTRSTAKKVEKGETKMEQTPNTNEEKSAEATAFDAFLDHQRKAFTEAGKALETLIPAGLRDHSQAAFKEMVEGYRKLFNAAMDEVVATVDRAKSTVGMGEKEAGKEENAGENTAE